MRTQYEKYLFSLIGRENETAGGGATVVDMKNASLLLRNCVGHQNINKSCLSSRTEQQSVTVVICWRLLVCL